jgi:hypothetical protein
MRMKLFLAVLGVSLATCATVLPCEAQVNRISPSRPQANQITAGGPSAAGLWQQADEKTGKIQGWFLISEKGAGVYEGIIAKMFLEPTDDPNPVCSRCEGAQKNAPWLGLTIITNMHRSGMSYEDGNILDPRDGTVYRALMRLSPDGQTLTVRGYLGIEMLGRNQIWQRLPDSAYAELDPSVNPQRQAAPTAPQRKSNPRTQSQGSAQGGSPVRR